VPHNTVIQTLRAWGEIVQEMDSKDFAGFWHEWAVVRTSPPLAEEAADFSPSLVGFFCHHLAPCHCARTGVREQRTEFLRWRSLPVRDSESQLESD
jgi:hypothetical protein